MTNPSDGAPVRHSTGRDRVSTVATPGQGPAGPVPRGRALPSVLRRPRRVPSRKSARIAAVLVAVPGARPDIGPSSSLLRLLAAPVGLILCPERPVEPHGLGLPRALLLAASRPHRWPLPQHGHGRARPTSPPAMPDALPSPQGFADAAWASVFSIARTASCFARTTQSA